MKHGHAWMGWVMALAFALPHGAHGAKFIRISDDLACLDEMETEPETDQAQAIPVAADSICFVTQTTISI